MPQGNFTFWIYFFMVCDFSFLHTFLLTFRRNATSCRFFLHPLAFKPSSRLPILANIITMSFLFLQGTKKQAFIRPCFSCWSKKKCSQILFSFLFFPFLADHKVRFDLSSAKSAKRDKRAAATFTFLCFRLLLCGSVGRLVNSFPLKWDFCFYLFPIYFWSASSVGWSII